MTVICDGHRRRTCNQVDVRGSQRSDGSCPFAAEEYVRSGRSRESDRPAANRRALRTAWAPGL